jgi:hypothetical protein
VDDRLRNVRLLAVAGLALVLFNYPMLAVFDKPVLVAGVPLLWAYLFIAWALVIALVGWISRP